MDDSAAETPELAAARERAARACGVEAAALRHRAAHAWGHSFVIDVASASEHGGEPLLVYVDAGTGMVATSEPARADRIVQLDARGPLGVPPWSPPQALGVGERLRAWWLNLRR